VARVIDVRKSRYVLGTLVLAHLIVISRQVDGGGGVSLLERGIFTVLSPFQTLVSRGISTISRAWSGYVDLRGVRGENQALRAQVRSLESLLQEQEHEASDAQRLRDLLELKPVLPIQTVAAEVTSRDSEPWFRSVSVDKGTRSGVALNAPVLSENGVVGRVVAVGPTAARVQLLLDRDSGVAVLLERSRASAVVKGQVGFADSGTQELVVKYLASNADVAQGDVVVTSGLDGIYPKGLLVGRILSVGSSSALFREGATVLPSARFSSLEEVLIARTTQAAKPAMEAVK
jgi:rod shape-determining protein MreC